MYSQTGLGMKGEEGGEKRFWVIYSGDGRAKCGFGGLVDNLLHFISPIQ